MVEVREGTHFKLLKVTRMGIQLEYKVNHSTAGVENDAWQLSKCVSCHLRCLDISSTRFSSVLL